MHRAIGVALLMIACGGGLAQDASSVTAAASLSVSASAPAYAAQGSDFTVTVTVQNSGDAAATGLDLLIPFGPPDSVSIVGMSSPGLSCDKSVILVHCTAASLAAGASSTVTILLTAVGSEGTAVVMNAYASAPGLSQSQAYVGITILAGPTKISVAESASAESAPPGGATSFSVTVANTGSDRTTFWLVFDLGPGAWSLTGATQTSGPGFSCSKGPAHAECSIGTFPGGASASFSFPVSLAANAQPGDVLNSRAYAFVGAPGGTALANDARPVVVAAPPPSGGGGGSTGGGSGSGTGTGSGSGSGSGTTDLVVIVSGAGSVSGNGIACPPTCSAAIAKGARVELRAAPTGTSAFQGWSGACSGSELVCSLVVNAATSASAAFAAVAIAPVPVTAKKCLVPSLVGRTLAQATGMLAARHCALGRVTRVRSTRAKGKIVWQAQRPGTSRAAKSRVDLRVSRGGR